MPASFGEVRMYSGVDEQRVQGHAMIVPVRGGSTFIRLDDGQNLTWAPDRSGLKITEVKRDAVEAWLSIPIYLSFGNPAVSLSVMIDMRRLSVGSPRFFEIAADRRLGLDGVRLKAKIAGASKPQATIRIVPLDQRVIRLAIRPVVVQDDSGKVVYHSQIPFDTNQMCSQMNSVWTPQANVFFNLVSSKPAPITDKAKIASALGTASKEIALSDTVDGRKLAPLLRPLANEQPAADFTMFLVRRVLGGKGMTYPDLGYACIGDDRGDDTMAHEPGHWMGVGDISNDRLSPGPPCLMCDYRSLKIPFDQTIGFFNRNF